MGFIMRKRTKGRCQALSQAQVAKRIIFGQKTGSKITCDKKKISSVHREYKEENRKRGRDHSFLKKRDPRSE